MDIVIKPGWKETIVRGFQCPSRFVKEILEKDLHKEQETCIDNMVGKEIYGVTAGNRWGKGDLITMIGSYMSAYKPVAPKFKDKMLSTLNTSISQDQANIVFDKFCQDYLDRPKFSWLIKDIKKSPFPHIVFRSRVTWWFRNASQDGKFLEGRSYFYANFDEADLQRLLSQFLDDILAPRLWDYGGLLSWTTTPRRGKKNAYKVWEWLAKQKKAGNERVGRFRGDSRNNHFLDKRAHERMARLPRRLFNKNVLGLYEDSDGILSNDICDYAELISDGLQDKPVAGAKYLNVWDFARWRTFNVGITLELSDPLQLRSWERTQQEKDSRTRTYWDLIKKRVRERHAKWKGRTIVDATGIGDVLASDLADIKPLELKLVGRVRDQIIEEGIATLEKGDLGLPLNGDSEHKGIEQIINGEFWCLRDELTDFDPEALDHIVWDFVCCLFIGAWYAKGYRPSSDGKKRKPPAPKAARATGRSKYAGVRR